MKDNASSWISTILASLKDTDEKIGKIVLEDCGKNCCDNSGMKDRAKELAEQTKNFSIEEKIEYLQDQFKDDIISFSMQSGMIYVEYSECACHLNKEDYERDDFICECTRGYCMRFLEAYLEKKVEVTVLKTILRGDDKCLMAIRVI